MRDQLLLFPTLQASFRNTDEPSRFLTRIRLLGHWTGHLIINVINSRAISFWHFNSPLAYPLHDCRGSVGGGCSQATRWNPDSNGGDQLRNIEIPATPAAPAATQSVAFSQ